MTKIAIVTGASRGFGRGTARILASEAGYKVYATARTRSALQSLQKEVPESNGAGEVIPVVLDQSDDEAVDAFVRRVSASEEKIDLLVNSAYAGLIAMTPHFGKPLALASLSLYPLTSHEVERAPECFPASHTRQLEEPVVE